MSPLERMQRPPVERQPLSRPMLIAAGLIGGGCALAALVVLTVLGRADGQGGRLAKLEEQVAAIEADGGRARASIYPVGVVCAGPRQGEAALRRRLIETAPAAGISLSEIAVSVGAASEDSGLTPMPFSLEATAQYDLLLGYLRQLAASQPQIFIDAADLTPKTSVVHLKLTGRVLCWTVPRR